MRRALLIAVSLVLLSARGARADDVPTQEPAPASPTPHTDGVRVAALAGASVGRLFDLTVRRLAIGVEGGGALQSAPVFLSGTMLVEPGETDNGLGAHRLEIGASIGTLPGIVRLSVGAHFAYVMLVRGTETNAFVHALFGDIGGFGVGGHGAVELGIPLGARTSLLLGGRVMGEVYSQASGWEIGPTAGIRY